MVQYVFSCIKSYNLQQFILCLFITFSRIATDKSNVLQFLSVILLLHVSNSHVAPSSECIHVTFLHCLKNHTTPQYQVFNNLFPNQCIIHSFLQLPLNLGFILVWNNNYCNVYVFRLLIWMYMLTVVVIGDRRLLISIKRLKWMVSDSGVTLQAMSLVLLCLWLTLLVFECCIQETIHARKTDIFELQRPHSSPLMSAL